MSALQRSLSPMLVPGLALLTAAFAQKTTGSLLTALAKHIPRPSGLHHFFLGNNGKIRTALGIVVALSLIRWANRFLNDMARNSWRASPPSDWICSKEIAVVTGGSGGIGRTVVEKLINKGLRVAVLDLKDPPEAFKEQARILFCKCNVTKPNEVAAVAEEIRTSIGHPTILINNAGICRPCRILDASAEKLYEIFSVNSLAHWLTVQQFLPDMIKNNKGHILTVASAASFLALPRCSDYSGSKSAARAFHDVLGSELKHFYHAPNVITTAVHTQFVRTPIIQDIQKRLDEEGQNILEADFVGEKIVERLVSKRGGVLILPESRSFLSGVAAWPAWMQEIVRDKYGRASAKRNE
ncbi:unnamed protein product [Clonostachys byssicola]|uniref:Uncharacterized protein n=1 Tax=Clonostachys byssicola TaxID=160290 RepID=A0A9N9U3W0_9HYPO|nr:unnamed protein product [Clonostachys byssicola]